MKVPGVECFLMSEVPLYSALCQSRLAPDVPTIEVLIIVLFGTRIKTTQNTIRCFAFAFRTTQRDAGVKHAKESWNMTLYVADNDLFFSNEWFNYQTIWNVPFYSVEKRTKS
jgi:hypothetical protein